MGTSYKYNATKRFNELLGLFPGSAVVGQTTWYFCLLNMRRATSIFDVALFSPIPAAMRDQMIAAPFRLGFAVLAPIVLLGMGSLRTVCNECCGQTWTSSSLRY